MKQIKLTPLAEADVELQARWYQDQRLGLDQEFVDAVQLTFQQRPASAPSFGTQDKRKRQVAPPFHRFSVFYREDVDAIWILAVWSADRNPTELGRR